MGRERVRTAAAPRHRPFLLHHPAEKEGCAGLGAGRGSALSPQGHIASCITPGDALRYHGLPGRREDPRNLLLFLHLHHSPPGSFSPALCMGMGKKKKKKAAAQSCLAPDKKGSRSGCSQLRQQHHPALRDLLKWDVWVPDSSAALCF